MSEPSALVHSYCPRCDTMYTAKLKSTADLMVRQHLTRADDLLHENALEEWDDDTVV